MTSKSRFSTGLVVAVLALCGCQEDSLLKASRTGELGTVKSLVEGGASVDKKDETGHTPLMAAASHGASEIVKYLVSKGAKVDLANNEGWTPLAYAVSVHDLETAKFLVQSGADLNAQLSHFQDGKRSILMQAVATTEGQDEKDKGYQTIQFLVAKGASVDARDSKGETALMYAVRTGKPGLVQLMLKSHADPSLRNKEGQTALDIARKAEDKKIIAVLQTAKQSG